MGFFSRLFGRSSKPEKKYDKKQSEFTFEPTIDRCRLNSDCPKQRRRSVFWNIEPIPKSPSLGRLSQQQKRHQSDWTAKCASAVNFDQKEEIRPDVRFQTPPSTTDRPVGQQGSILDRSEQRRWKGVIFGPKYSSRSGRFPADTVELIDKKIGMQRSASQRQVKKVGVPMVPDIPGMTSSSTSNGHSANLLNSNCSSSSNGTLSRHSTSYGSLGSTHVQHAIDGKSPLRKQSPGNGLLAQYSNVYQHQTSTTNGNSPARHRNSTGSNSSQASSGFESMKSNGQTYTNVTVHQLRGDSPPSRNSVHSSGSSSLGSLERLDESGYGSSGHINVAEMVLNGVPDRQVLAAWLQKLHYEEYLSNFLNAGYDLPTVARITPEDLMAIGITKPGHRKRLTTEIHRLNVADTWPDKTPASVSEWLCLLQLSEYVPLFEKQGLTDINQVTKFTWEDYEDSGIKKLGHLKKLVLASKKLKDCRHQMQSSSSNGAGGCQSSSTELLLINLPQSSSTSAHGRTTAEVKPYAYVPPSEAVMSTFQQQQNSPRHRLTNGQQDTPSPIRRPSGSLELVTTEAIVHDRPKLSVKPLLSMTTTCNGQEHCCIDGQHSDELKQQTLSPRHQSLVSKCYASLLINGDTLRKNGGGGDLMTRSAPASAADPPKKPPIGPFAKPGAVFQLSATPNYSGITPAATAVDDSSSCDLSPAPSMEEFPPPPSPIMCMESIRNLHNVRQQKPPMEDSELAELETAASLSGTMARRRTLTNGHGLTQQQLTNGGQMSSSIDSNSSTETLPFANENVGTIKQRGSASQAGGAEQPAVQQPTTPRRKPHINELFGGNANASLQTGLKVASTNNKGNVLNDIGCMLQDLTDELDAMLMEPKSTTVNQPQFAS